MAPSAPGGEGGDGCTKLRRPRYEDAAVQNLFSTKLAAGIGQRKFDRV